MGTTGPLEAIVGGCGIIAPRRDTAPDGGPHERDHLSLSRLVPRRIVQPTLDDFFLHRDCIRRGMLAALAVSSLADHIAVGGGAVRVAEPAPLGRPVAEEGAREAPRRTRRIPRRPRRTMPRLR